MTGASVDEPSKEAIRVSSSQRQLTRRLQGHILANRNVWSADGRSLLYDTRDEETEFTGKRIERVFIDRVEVQTLYESPADSCCGVPTCSPVDDRYVFIHGPLNQSDSWRYCAWHRRGAIGQFSQPGLIRTLDARNLVPPYTPGALRGGTHLHTFSPDGSMVASTYEDHVLASIAETDEPSKWPDEPSTRTAQSNRRVVAISVLNQSVSVPRSHPRNHDGCSFTVVVTEVTEHPVRGSDQIGRAYSEAWIDHRRLAFLADVHGENGRQHSELYIADLPEDLTAPAGEPLQGTAVTRPGVPQGVVVRRLTRTDQDPDPGMAGPRHWAVASPDQKWIGCFRKDRSGHAQFFVADILSGELHVITAHPFSASSAFTWHPDARSVAYIADGSVFQTYIDGRKPIRLTPRASAGEGPTHHACVFSPDGSQIAFMQPVVSQDKRSIQIFCVESAS